jgi:sugar/nucleoside kinase (ribokinase family)
MLDILIMGEIIVEIMRDKEDSQLYEADYFKGPYPSGAPAICIDAAARLGCKTAIIGGVGKDDFGKCLIDRLNKDGVDTSRVIESEERSTGCAFVTYFADGSRKYIFHMGNTPAVEAKAPAEGTIEIPKYMHIMGCSLMANKDYAQEILKTMRMVVAGGGKISFDPNIRKELFTDDSINAVIQEVMDNTSIFLPGVEELLMVTGAEDVDAAVEKCFTYGKMEMVALKNGSKGSKIFTKDGITEVGVYKVVQADATGAGDCFDGAFLAGLCQGKSIEEAAKMGAAAGALNAAAFGPMEGKISPESVQAMIDGTYTEE